VTEAGGMNIFVHWINDDGSMLYLNSHEIFEHFGEITIRESKFFYKNKFYKNTRLKFDLLLRIS